MKFNAYDDVMAHLDRLGLFHMDMGLDRIRAVLDALNLSRLPFPVVQVVGTNGKGSTSTFLASIATAHGRRAGLYTSPHFVTPRERIRIAGTMIEPQLWPVLGNRILEAGGETLTYFEFLTVLGMLAFREADIDIAVVEAGLGGTWDATTAIEANLLCVTPIGFDHEKVLGNTLTAIATDKAGAMRPWHTAITAPQEPEAMRALRHVATERHTQFLVASDVATLPADVRLGLRGPHQRSNALLALAAWQHVAAAQGWEIDETSIRRGLGAAHIPGRYQSVEAAPEQGIPFPLLLDGAHNAHGLAALRAALEADGIRPAAVIFSCLADKNLDAIVPLLRHIAAGAPFFVPTIADNDRAAAGTDIAARIGEGAVAVPRLKDALHAAASAAPQASQAAPVLLCGSLYLLAEFFTLRPDQL